MTATVRIRKSTLRKAIDQVRKSLKNRKQKSTSFNPNLVLTVLRTWIPMPFDEEDTAKRIQSLI